MVRRPGSEESGDFPFHEMILGETGIAVDGLEDGRSGDAKSGSESVAEEARRTGAEAETGECGFLILHERGETLVPR